MKPLPACSLVMNILVLCIQKISLQIFLQWPALPDHSVSLKCSYSDRLRLSLSAKQHHSPLITSLSHQKDYFLHSARGWSNHLPPVAFSCFPQRTPNCKLHKSRNFVCLVHQWIFSNQNWAEHTTDNKYLWMNEYISIILNTAIHVHLCTLFHMTLV